MQKSTKREQMRQERRKKQTRTYLLAALAGVVFIALISYVAIQAAGDLRAGSGLQGEEIPEMESSAHVEEGTDPGPYNSDPPTSGRHYEEDLAAGFYEEADAAAYGEHPEGYLVHSLEHGYVIFWYNCDVLSTGDCDTLKEQIRTVMDGAGNREVIAFPWKSIDVPVVMTSWGRLQQFETFDPEQAAKFVETNLNHAPEPMAD